MMGLPVETPFRNRAKTHLRVTFQKDGRVLGRAVSETGQVRWGPALGIEFSYPAPGLEDREELFGAGREGGRLILHEGMVGEIWVGSTHLALEDLQNWGLVSSRKGRRWVQLTREMEGCFEYRGVLISFDYGSPPAPREVERLGRVPLRFRRGLLRREEWPFAILTWGLYAALLYVASQLSSLPLPDAARPEKVAQRFAKLIYEAPQVPTRARSDILRQIEETPEEGAKPEPEPVEPEAEPEAEPAAPEVAEAEQTPSPEVVPEELHPVPETPPQESAPVEPQASDAPAGEAGSGPGFSREEVRERVAKKGLLGLLSGRGAASTARTRGSILEGRGAAEDLDRVLENVEGLRSVGGSGGEGGGTGVGVPGGVPGGIDAAARQVASATRSVRLEARKEQVVEATEKEEFDELSLKEAVAAIHRAVGAYLGGIRYLYNRELRKNPDLEGKLTVSITVSPEGEVLACEVVDSTLDSPPLVKAVLKRILKWKLPAVAPRPITVTYPFVFFPSM